MPAAPRHSGQRTAPPIPRRPDVHGGTFAAPTAFHWGPTARSPPGRPRPQTMRRASGETRARRPSSRRLSRVGPSGGRRPPRQRGSRSRRAASRSSWPGPSPDMREKRVEGDEQEDGGEKNRGAVELVDHVVERDGAKVVGAERCEDEADEVREKSEGGRGEREGDTAPGRPRLHLGIGGAESEEGGDGGDAAALVGHLERHVRKMKQHAVPENGHAEPSE